MFDLLEQILACTAEMISRVLYLVGGHQSALTILGSTALVGGMGAYFGAKGAQNSINRAASIRSRTKIIIAANASHSLSAVIFNQAASLKKQHYLPMLESWQMQRDRVLDAINRGERPKVELHMQTPPPMHFPTGALTNLVYSKLTLNGRPLAALAEIVQAEHTLSIFIEEHQALRSEFEGNSGPEIVYSYLAMDTPNVKDSRYHDVVHGFVDALDDLLFFSDLLGRDLLTYGGFVRESTARRLRKNLPQLNTQGPILPGFEYLFPKRDHHRKWLENHNWEVQKQVSIWRRLWQFGKKNKN